MITLEEAKQLSPIIADFVRSYAKKSSGTSDGEWLFTQLKANLPDKSDSELTQIRDEIVDGIQVQEESKKSLDEAISRGRSKESWFAEETKRAVSGMSALESEQYLRNLDEAVETANQQLWDTITTKSGAVNRNPNLDGFIAEEHHAQTFNMNAAARGSHYRARVLKPEGKSYSKNSVDVVVDNLDTGRITRRYQVKYGKDAQHSRAMYDSGEYRGQRLLTPDDQINAPDGTTSNILTKQQAKELQAQAQSQNGKLEGFSWNDYAIKDVAKGIAKSAGQAGAMGFLTGAGFELAAQIYNGEDIDGEELIKTGLATGADFSIKGAVAGGLKVASEKGILSALPKGTPVDVFTTVAFVAVENVKVMGKVASGELTPLEGLEKIEQVTVSSVNGLTAAAKGAAIGAKALACLGPAGAAVGGFVGGTIGYMAGSSFGTAVVTGYQKVRRVVVEHVVKPIVNTAKKAWEGAKSFVSGLLSWL